MQAKQGRNSEHAARCEISEGMLRGVKSARACCAVALLFVTNVIGFSVLDIEGGGSTSMLGAGGSSDLYVVGTDLGSPFTPPVVLIGNNPNPRMATCAVETFTSMATRFH